jgi:hypothetical protein
LRNGITDRAEIDAYEADHRRRMGMVNRKDRAAFEAWLTSEYTPNAPELTDHIIDAMWQAWQAGQRP